MSPGDGVSSLVCFFLFEANRAASQFRLWRIEPHRVATRSFMLFFLLLTALSFFQTDQPPYRWCCIRMHPLPPQTSPTSRRRKRLSLSLQEGHSTRLDWSRNRSRCDCLHLLGFAVRRCCKSTLVFLVVWVKQARTGLTFSPFDLLPPLLPFFLSLFQEKPWNSAAVIVLFVMIPVSLGLLVAWESYLGPERAMMPLALFSRRTIIGCAGTSCE